MGFKAWAVAAAMAVSAWAGPAGAAVHYVDIPVTGGDASIAPLTMHPGDMATLFVHETNSVGWTRLLYYYVTLRGVTDGGEQLAVEAGGFSYGGVAQWFYFNELNGVIRSSILAGAAPASPDGASLFLTYFGGMFAGDGVTFNSVRLDLHGDTPIPGVPEPSTWALMLLDFGGLAVMRRWRSRAAA